jgi:serine protease Do
MQVPGWVWLVPLCLGAGVFLGQSLPLRPEHRVWSGPPETPADQTPVTGTLPSLAPIVQRAAPSVVAVRAILRLDIVDPEGGRGRGVRNGSGFVVHKDGIVVTSRHIVADALSILVRIPGEYERPAALVGEDPITDLAVLRIDDPPRGLQALELGRSEAMRAGDWVVCVGNPFEFSQTVTVGVVSFVGRHLDHYDLHVTNDFLQFSAPVNPGSSGSPVLDLEGRVVGVTTQAAESAQNISFAIPSRTLKWVLEQLDHSADGRVHRGFLGIRFQTRPGSDDYGHPLEGAVITKVLEGEPAERGGLRTGDVVLYCDDQKVTDAGQFHERVSRARPGSPMRLVVMRQDRVLAPIEVKVGEVGVPPSGA